MLQAAIATLGGESRPPADMDLDEVEATEKKTKKKDKKKRTAAEADTGTETMYLYHVHCGILQACISVCKHGAGQHQRSHRSPCLCTQIALDFTMSI